MSSTNAGPRSFELQIQPAEDAAQSLVYCLEAILNTYGCRVDPDELAVVLGDAVLVSYAAEAPSDERWNVYGRHVFLEAAARLYGLELRDLHPPDAAPLPVPPPEFVGHFADSYLPLVRTALGHGYSALAWMGWPSPGRTSWGVVTGIDASGHLVGKTPFSHDRAIELEGPPVQVYTVQEFRDRRPKPEETLDVALGHIASILNNRAPPKYRVVTGIQALEKWREEPTASVRVARSMAEGRQSAVRFLQRLVDRRKEASEYATIFKEQVAALALLTGIDDKMETIDRVIELERRASRVGANRR